LKGSILRLLLQGLDVSTVKFRVVMRDGFSVEEVSRQRILFASLDLYETVSL
tara:strand:- start:511 stop:666 length:156 start_codon:yes stop_codon:yes gene_type:complete